MTTHPIALHKHREVAARAQHAYSSAVCGGLELGLLVHSKCLSINVPAGQDAAVLRRVPESLISLGGMRDLFCSRSHKVG